MLEFALRGAATVHLHTRATLPTSDATASLNNRIPGTVVCLLCSTPLASCAMVGAPTHGRIFRLESVRAIPDPDAPALPPFLCARVLGADEDGCAPTAIGSEDYDLSPGSDAGQLSEMSVAPFQSSPQTDDSGGVGEPLVKDVSG